MQEKQNGHRAILQNFANALRKGEELIAPGCDGLAQLAIQNAAYLSAWKGSVPVSIPFDRQEYDALLAQKQRSSSAGKCAAKGVNSTAYSSRWQINW